MSGFLALFIVAHVHVVLGFALVCHYIDSTTID
jgi:hypothetical protein